ncbi:unnamed protein product [marine sediment metagenome]|uniref:Uncharacterized protein n=1 Tax=marine sediment metagenome TaxID=412755 RepID=X1FCL9_9ZZZZ
MARNLRKVIKDIQAELEEKQNVPINDFKKAFMIVSGYGKNKINEWTWQFEELDLIKISGGIVTFV